MQTHTSGLLMHYAMDSTSMGGLALRRCSWKANTLNERSVAASKRMGFAGEGVIRADSILMPGKEGVRGECDLPARGPLDSCKDGRPDEREELKSRDTWTGSVLWDDWEDAVKEHVDKLMERR